MKNQLLIAAGILIPAGATLVAAEEAYKKDAESSGTIEPEEVLARYEQAIGGAEAHELLRVRESLGTVSFPAASPSPFKFSKLQKSPDHVLVEYESNGARIHAEGHDGRTAWTWNPESGPVKLSRDERRAKLRDFDMRPYLDLDDDFDELSYEGTEVVDGTEYEVVKGVDGKEEEYFYFDADTHLLHIVRNEDFTLKLGAYREIDEVWLCFETDLEDPDGEPILSVRLKTISHEVEVDDQLFGMPAK